MATQEEIKMMRDYSLVGVETQKAIEMGLADAEWYQTPIPKAKMREFLQRKNGPAIRDTFIWFGLIIGSGYLIFLFWGAWYVVFPILLYSVLFASTSDSRWHESSHGTAFKTDWMNNLLYEISSFMVFRQSTVWRWSHARHHSDTIIRGRDPEIAVPRPPNIKKITLGFFGIPQGWAELKRMVKHASGKIDKEVATYVPDSEYQKVFWKARVYLFIFAAVIFLAIYFQTFLPLFYVGIPTHIGTWLMPIYGMTQHAGLQENVLDHRLNCRTVYMNRVHRFLYWNMNYHIEHHMFPLVPYHALPRLHKLMKNDCPQPYKNITSAYKEIIPAILKQVKDPSYFVERKLPKTSAKKNKNNDVLNLTGKPEFATNGKIRVFKVAQLQESEIIRFDFEQKTYAICKTKTGKYYATDGICSHGNAHLADGVVIGNTLECGKHNGRFNLKNGSPGRMPVCVGINTYPVIVENGFLMLGLNIENKATETITCKVISNKNVSAFIKELTLEPVQEKPLQFQPGQYIHLKIPPYKLKFDEIKIGNHFKKTWDKLNLWDCVAENKIYTHRNYSMANNPETKKQLKFNVRISLPPENNKGLNAGAGSSFVFQLKPGDIVELSGPYGDFLIKDTDREMVYIGGGAGMAPLRSHLSYLFETHKTKRKVSFWYGARTTDDIFYDDYLNSLKKANNNFSFNVALSENKGQTTWKGYSGFIHQVVLDEYLKHHKNPGGAEYYLCGPPAMIQACLTMLNELGIPENQIAFDEF